MPPENPYAAPQSSFDQPYSSDSEPPPRGSWAEREPLAEGARLCLLAIWNTLGAIGVLLAVGIVLNLGGLAVVIMLCLLAVAGICHGVGLYRLLDVPPETRTRGLIRLSLITFLIAVAGNLFEGFSKVGGQKLPVVEYSLGQTALSMLTYGSLTLALLRIARWYRHDGASWSAKVALVINLLTYGALVLFYIALLTPGGQDLLRSWQSPHRERELLVTLIVWAGFAIIGVVYYARTLWQLRKMAEEA